ncbi:MAG TPA: hypothetical protein HPP77_03665 [Candidatus Hydrogenedentes bacterium]|nr:hypothetical protein [Candidatus Hydrogenedentota bacterium]
MSACRAKPSPCLASLRTGNSHYCLPYNILWYQRFPRKQRPLLRGDLPSPLHPPSGCVFHPRCLHATPECAQRVPELKPFRNEQQAACIRLNAIHASSAKT